MIQDLDFRMENGDLAPPWRQNWRERKNAYNAIFGKKFLTFLSFHLWLISTDNCPAKLWSAIHLLRKVGPSGYVGVQNQ